MKKSTMSAIAALSVAGALAVGLGAVSDWYTNWDTSTWFGRGQKTEQPKDPETPDTPADPNADKDNAIVTVGESKGIQLLSAKLPRNAYAANGVSEQADTAYRLTATVLPEDATDKTVTFSAAWKNPSSTWANGKKVTDYLSLSASGATATVACTQAFGEQIVITCTSADNSEAFATCTVDFEKKVSSVSAKIVDSSTGATYLWLKSDGSYDGGVPITSKSPYPTCNISYDVTYTVGTVNNSSTQSLKMKITSCKVGYWGSIYCSMSTSDCFSERCTHTIKSETTIALQNSAAYDLTMLRSMIRTVQNKEISDSVLRYSFSKPAITFDLYLYGDGNLMTTYTAVPYNQDLLHVAVQDITLDNGSIVF